MKPETSTTNRDHCAAQSSAQPRPTSPWTEPYQCMSHNDAARPSFDSEDQRPTHDALSDIYNRGYE